MHAKPLLLLRLTGSNSEKKKVRQLHIVGNSPPQRTCHQHTQKKLLQLYSHTNRGPKYKEEKQVTWAMNSVREGPGPLEWQLQTKPLSFGRSWKNKNDLKGSKFGRHPTSNDGARQWGWWGPKQWINSIVQDKEGCVKKKGDRPYPYFSGVLFML